MRELNAFVVLQRQIAQSICSKRRGCCHSTSHLTNSLYILSAIHWIASLYACFCARRFAKLQLHRRFQKHQCCQSGLRLGCRREPGGLVSQRSRFLLTISNNPWNLYTKKDFQRVPSSFSCALKQCFKKDILITFRNTGDQFYASTMFQ